MTKSGWLDPLEIRSLSFFLLGIFSLRFIVSRYKKVKSNLIDDPDDLSGYNHVAIMSQAPSINVDQHWQQNIMWKVVSSLQKYYFKIPLT